MRSEKQIAAARADVAKSRRPVTAQGERNSSCKRQLRLESGPGPLAKSMLKHPECEHKMAAQFLRIVRVFHRIRHKKITSDPSKSNKTNERQIDDSPETAPNNFQVHSVGTYVLW
jgi:hypothetical protein